MADTSIPTLIRNMKEQLALGELLPDGIEEKLRELAMEIAASEKSLPTGAASEEYFAKKEGGARSYVSTGAASEEVLAARDEHVEVGSLSDEHLLNVDASRSQALDELERRYYDRPPSSGHMENEPARRQADTIDDFEATSAVFLEGVNSLGFEALPVLIQVVRKLVTRIFELSGENVVLKELAERGVPKWSESVKINSIEWLEQHFSEYLTYFGAPIDRLFQFQLGRYDSKLVDKLRRDIDRCKFDGITDLAQVIKTKPDYLKMFREIFHDAHWEFFARTWAAWERAKRREKKSH